MTEILFDYPKSSAFGRVLPKSKIYEHSSARSTVKECFVREVEQIVWQYKLAPETINLPRTRFVPELQIFSIALKKGELSEVVLNCIDQSIPFPILFELRYEEKTKVIAAYKRPSETDSSKWLVSEYFESIWLSSSTPRTPLPLVLNLEMLYAYLLDALLPYTARSGEGLQARVERMELIRSKEWELEECEARLRGEKQFNRKVSINAELRCLKEQVEDLTRSAAIAIT
jgi:hypothetical protein